LHVEGNWIRLGISMKAAFPLDKLSHSNDIDHHGALLETLLILIPIEERDGHLETFTSGKKLPVNI
jgi:hypothetical protein